MYPGLSFVFSWLHGIDLMHDVAQLRVDGGTFRFVFSWLHGIDTMHDVAQLRVDGGTFLFMASWDFMIHYIPFLWEMWSQYGIAGRTRAPPCCGLVGAGFGCL